MRKSLALLLASLVSLLSGQTGAADLVIWWESGFYPSEDAAVREMVAAFESKTQKNVELDFYPIHELPKRVRAALEAGQPPDFAFNGEFDLYGPQWAYEGRLVDLEDALASLSDLFEKDTLDAATLRDAHTGHRALYGLPMTRFTNHVHVWRSLLEQAGFRLDDIPREWTAFWSFWCDRVQSAVRKALGREDIYGVGLAMSIEAGDTTDTLDQFLFARTSEWPTPTGPNILDPPARGIFIKALTEYTDLYRKGCTPPDAISWTNRGNNEAFLAQRILATPNTTLSIPSALRESRPQDYYKNVVTIDWPADVYGRSLRLVGGIESGAVFAAGEHVGSAKDFVRFLVGEGWLAHWLDFGGDRYLPPMRNLVEQPFWLDPGDPHRLHSAIQALTRQHVYGYWGIIGDAQRQFGAADPPIYGTAVHRVAADGISPEQATDEAIARIKQILGE